MKGQSIYTGFKIALFYAFIATPLVLYWFGEQRQKTATEQRSLTSLPPPPINLQQLANWPQRFEAHFNDHFGLREALLFWHNRIKVGIGVSPLSKVIVGRDGWLFYRPDHSQATPSILRQQWQQRRRQLAASGIPYLVAVVPDKRTIYPEHLPAGLADQSACCYQRALTHLQHHTHLPVVDLRRFLLAAKNTDRLYFKTDSHWNFAGANVAQHAILTHAAEQLPLLRPVLYPQARLRWSVAEGGDLARMLGLAQQYPESRPALSLSSKILPCIRKQALRPDSPNDILNSPLLDFPDALFFTECPGLPYRILVIRDSFSGFLQPYISQHFGSVTYLWHTLAIEPIIRRLTSSNRPDLVIEQITERSLSTE